MNTDMTLTAAGPLVTEHSWALSPAVFVGGFLAVVGVSVLIGVVVIFFRTQVEDISGTALLVAGMVGAMFALLGLLMVEGERRAGGRDLNANRVTEVISEQYRITSIEAVADDDEDEPTAAQLCEPVSPKSPEYIGVADGQQIRFKAGSTNCTSNTPDITIIVTETPGAALSADDLRKADTTEEP